MDQIDFALRDCFLHFKRNWEHGGGVPMNSILAVKDVYFKDFDWKCVAKRITDLATEDFLDLKEVGTGYFLVYITDEGKRKLGL